MTFVGSSVSRLLLQMFHTFSRHGITVVAMAPGDLKQPSEVDSCAVVPNGRQILRLVETTSVLALLPRWARNQKMQGWSGPDDPARRGLILGRVKPDTLSGTGLPLEPLRLACPFNLEQCGVEGHATGGRIRWLPGRNRSMLPGCAEGPACWIRHPAIAPFSFRQIVAGVGLLLPPIGLDFLVYLESNLT